MIDEKALLCAFAYAEYESNCYDTQQPGQDKQAYMKMCLEYIHNKQNYPLPAIESIINRMKKEFIADPRDYIYSAHIKTIMNNIEQRTRKQFYTSIKNPLILRTAMNCPTNLYKVITARKNKIIGQNMITRKKHELDLIDGLEIPKPNQIVSGHWDYCLEIINESILLKKYLPRINAYLMRIKERIA